MTALLSYVVCLLVIHVAWGYFYLCGSLIRGAGDTIAARSSGGGALVEIVITTACGMAITGFVSFALGLAHLLYPLVIVIWLVVLAAAFAYRGDPPWRPAFWKVRLLVWRAAVSPGALMIYGVALFYGFASARPDIGSDATSYHLVYPLEWANAHGIFVDMALRVPYYATNWALLDMWFLMFHLVEATQTLSWLASLLTLLGIYGYVTACVERRNGRLEPIHVGIALLAAAAVAGSVVFLEAANTALIDVPMGFFFLTPALAFADAVRARRWNSLWVLVLCSGFFMGMKSSLIVFYPAFFACVAFVVLLLRAHLRQLAVALVALTVLAAPWYVKNFIQAGDPITPYLNIAVQGVDPHWSRDDAHGLAIDLRAGEATSPGGRLLVPLRSLTDASSPAFRADGGTLMVLLVWVPALMAVYALLRRGRVRELETFALAGLVVYGVGYWLATSTQSRYALVFLPALAALLGATLAGVAVRAPRFRWAAAAVALFCAIPTTQNVASARLLLASNEDFWNSYRDRDSWLIPRAPTYPEVMAVSDALRRSGKARLRVFRAYMEFDRLYFAERGIGVAGDLFGPERYLDFQQAVVSDEMQAYIKRFDIGAFIVPTMWEGNFPKAQQQQLWRELEALGFHRASVTSAWDVYLSPEVR